MLANFAQLQKIWPRNIWARNIWARNIWVWASLIAVTVHATPITLMFIFQPQPPLLALGTTFIELSPIVMESADTGASEDEQEQEQKPAPTKPKKQRVSAPKRPAKPVTKPAPVQTKPKPISSPLVPPVQKQTPEPQPHQPPKSQAQHIRSHPPIKSQANASNTSHATPTISAQKPRRPQTHQRTTGTNPPPRSTVIGVQNGETTKDPKAIWRAELIAHLTRYKRYPAPAQRRKQEGTPVVQILLGRDGTVENVILQTVCRHRLLNIEAVNLVGRASPLPPPPPEIFAHMSHGGALEINVPIKFEVTY